jgi:hypothetical protein
LLYAWGFTAAPFLLLALPLQLSLRDPTIKTTPTWQSIVIQPPAIGTNTSTNAAFLPYLAAAWAAAAIALRLAFGLILFTAFLRSCSQSNNNGPLSPTRTSNVQGLSRRAVVYVVVGTLLSLAVWLGAVAPGYNAQLGLVSSLDGSTTQIHTQKRSDPSIH